MISGFKSDVSVGRNMSERARRNGKDANGGGGDRQSISIGGSLDHRSNVKMSPKPFEELPPEVQKVLVDRRKLRNDSRTLMDAIEGKYVLSLILYLDRMSPVLKSDIYADISRSAGMIRKIDDLQNLWIIQIYHTARTNTNVIVITDKGRTVAERIRDLIKSIERL